MAGCGCSCGPEPHQIVKTDHGCDSPCDTLKGLAAVASQQVTITDFTAMGLDADGNCVKGKLDVPEPPDLCETVKGFEDGGELDVGSTELVGVTDDGCIRLRPKIKQLCDLIADQMDTSSTAVHVLTDVDVLMRAPDGSCVRGKMTVPAEKSICDLIADISPTVNTAVPIPYDQARWVQYDESGNCFIAMFEEYDFNVCVGLQDLATATERKPLGDLLLFDVASCEFVTPEYTPPDLCEFIKGLQPLLSKTDISQVKAVVTTVDADGNEVCGLAELECCPTEVEQASSSGGVCLNLLPGDQTYNSFTQAGHVNSSITGTYQRLNDKDYTMMGRARGSFALCRYTPSNWDPGYTLCYFGPAANAPTGTGSSTATGTTTISGFDTGNPEQVAYMTRRLGHGDPTINGVMPDNLFTHYVTQWAGSAENPRPFSSNEQTAHWISDEATIDFEIAPGESIDLVIGNIITLDQPIAGGSSPESFFLLYEINVLLWRKA